MNIRDFLYESGKIHVAQKNVAQTGITGIGCSTYRKGEFGAPKISNAAVVLDIMLTDSASFSAYFKDDILYAEYGSKKYLISSGKVYASDVTSTRIICGMLALWRSKFNLEIDALIRKAVHEYERSAIVEGDIIYTLCDSFLFEYVVTNPTIELLNMDQELLESIKKSFGKGEYQMLDILNEIKGIGKSEYDVPKKTRKTRSKKELSFWEKCKNGDFALPYTWNPAVADKIISLDYLNTYEPTKEFEEIVKKVYYYAKNAIDEILKTGSTHMKKPCNILVVGKPGTGKTTVLNAVAATLQIPIGVTIHTKTMEEDEYSGKTVIVNSKPEFVPTASLLLHEYGGIEICEEINIANPSVTMGGLGQKLAYPFLIKKNGTENVYRHALNIVFATMNVGTSGSNGLNQALLNRFGSVFVMNDPTQDQFISILEKATGESKTVCAWAYSAYDRTKSYLISPQVNEEEVNMNLSIRTCIGLIENMKEGQNPYRALQNSIGGVISAVDMELGTKVYNECLETIPLPTENPSEYGGI